MLTNKAKRQIFFRLRFENYRASLRFESLVPSPVSAGQPVVAPGATR